MTATVLIGLGNPLCADDGVGVAVARLIGHLPRTRVVEGGTPGLGLLDLMEGYHKAILVDAVVSGAPPGTIHRFTMEALPPREYLPLSLHGVNAVDALSIGRAVAPERLPPEIVILGMEAAERTPFRTWLSPEVVSAMPRLLAAVRQEAKIKQGGPG